ncbi:MAG: AsmA family protein, partial [Nevskiales bacterium]
MARRRRPVLRITLVTVAALLVAIVGVVVVGLARIDPDRLKPRIAAAVKQATGRDLLLRGPIHLSFSLQPSVQVTDVSFSNPPGFSRPMMATLQRLDLQLA